jgi:hypothetical protein
MLDANDLNSVYGNGGAVSFGLGYLKGHLLFSGHFDILLGPYEQMRDRSFSSDFAGTGFSTFVAYSSKSKEQAQGGYTYGLGLGATYEDAIGRSSGSKNVDLSALGPQYQTDEVSVQNYIIQTQTGFLTPTFYFAWLKPPRPKGNTPELLKTRLEGYLLSLGVSFPVYSQYRAKYDQRQEDASFKGLVDNGKLKGYRIALGITTLLGI